MERAADYEFDLPPELVAQYPSPERGEDRMLVLGRETGSIHHGRFGQLVSWLRAGDLLVLNDTKVLNARLHGRKPTGGNVEILLVRKSEEENWECMLRTPHRVKAGLKVLLGEDRRAEVVRKGGEGMWVVSFSGFESRDSVPREAGVLPLPPYVRRDPEPSDSERYQTVFAADEGSVAAPTAGLHFTESMLEALEAMGVEIRRLTLHVGPGTFRPMRSDLLENHRLEPEFFSIPDNTVGSIESAIGEGRRVIAVGTTVTRVLEYVSRKQDVTDSISGWTDLFIRPPFDFKVVSGLLTNFHLPRSSLLALVSAFAGRRPILRAYQEAILQKYRFYSYGDAMLIV